MEHEARRGGRLNASLNEWRVKKRALDWNSAG